MISEIKVSIICTTYNHSNMLRQSLDSFLMQKTTFPFEIIVHDDCSTDDTTDILREYASNYPNIIVPVYEETNQYFSGRDYVYELTRDYAGGKYIAFCEGDDYWNDENKLQLQFDILEAHPDIDLCTTQGAVLSAKTGKKIGSMRPKTEDCIIPVEDVISGGGQYFATASLFMRREVYYPKLYSFERIMPIDYAWQIRGSLRGGCYYIDREMVAYRSGVDGSWNVRMEGDLNLRKAHTDLIIKMLETLDEDTEYKYHAVIENRINMTRNGHISFYDQLVMHKEKLLPEIEKEGCYIWGNGKRSIALQRFCKESGITVKGICDRVDASIGEMSESGYKIVSTADVRSSDSLIVATNKYIYKDLSEENADYNLLNLQDYIPWEE